MIEFIIIVGVAIFMFTTNSRLKELEFQVAALKANVVIYEAEFSGEKGRAP